MDAAECCQQSIDDLHRLIALTVQLYVYDGRSGVSQHVAQGRLRHLRAEDMFSFRLKVFGERLLLPEVWWQTE